MAKKLRIFFAQVSPPGQYDILTPPLGLLYLAAYLRERFPLEIRVVNQRLEGWSSEELGRKIVEFEADIAGLGCLTPSAHALPVVTSVIRATRPQTLIVLGGAHVTAARESVLIDTDADVAVVGEGERALELVVQAFLTGSKMTDIPGLIRRAEDDEIIINPGVMPQIEDLDSLPLPAYDLIDIKDYWRRPSFGQMPKRKYIAMFSTRGCPYQCIFCNKTFGREFRMLSPERMMEEIGHYKKHYDIDEIEYVDECFNLNVNRVKAYTDLLLNRMGPIKTSFPNGIRVDLLHDEIVDTMVAAGMYFAAMPLESGSPRVQKLVGKHLDIPKYLDAVEACVKRGVFTHGFTMFGFPTETALEMNETIRIAANSQLHTCSFFIPVPFPNTPLHQYVMEHMPEKIPENYYNDIDSRFMGVNFSDVPDDEFFHFFKSLPRKFFLRPNRIARIVRDYPKRRYLPLKGASFVVGHALKRLKYL